MRGKLHIELEASISRNDCLSRSYFERVVNGKTSDGIYDFQKHPWNRYVKGELIVKSYLFAFANTTKLCEPEINKLLTQL